MLGLRSKAKKKYLYQQERKKVSKVITVWQGIERDAKLGTEKCDKNCWNGEKTKVIGKSWMLFKC